MEGCAADVVFVVCSGGGISMAVPPCAAVDLGVEALVMSPDFVSEQGFSPASSSSDSSLAVFSRRRLFGGRQRRRNKVLQTSLSFVGVCSGAGVGSVSSYIGVSTAYLVVFLSVDASHAWSHKGIATCPSSTDLSGDLKKDAVLVYV